MLVICVYDAVDGQQIQKLCIFLSKWNSKRFIYDSLKIIHLKILILREKRPNKEFFSGPYFPVFGLNTGKCEAEKNLYLDTFYAESQGKRTLIENFRAFEKYEYEHLGGWYIKTSLYEVLKLKQNFQKNKVVTGKTPCFVIGPFCTAHSVCLNIGF